MSTITQDDLPRIASVLRLAGELLEAHGSLVFDLTRQWERGPRSANLEPSRSNRVDRVEDVDGATWNAPITIGDPTGEAILADDPTAKVHAELLSHLGRAFADCAWLRDLVAGLVPPVSAVGDPVEWCENHLRIQVCEPRHRGDLCRWCYEFKSLNGQVPPPVLLGARQRGQRITEQMVLDSLKAEKGRRITRDRVDSAVRASRAARAVERPSARVESAAPARSKVERVDDAARRIRGDA